MQVKKQQLELDMEQQTGSKLGKERVKAIYYHPAYLTYMHSTSCEISITSEMQMKPPFMAENEKELNSLLMKVKEESEKPGLELSIQKMKIMAFGSITSWQIDGGTMETVTDFIFGGSKITADGDCNHEIKRCFLLRNKAMTNLDSILKSRDITLLTKVRLVKAMVFPVIMYEYVGAWSFSPVWLFASPCMDFFAICQATLSMDMRVGPKRRLSAEESMLLNCGAGEDS